MLLKHYFNDSPIENAEEDLYGISHFSDALAKSIINIQAPVGTTIALNGPWGSGKSSAINLIRSALIKANDTKLVVTEFKCWWYRGEEALALAFLQQLNTVLGDAFGDNARNLIRKLGRGILQAGPIIGPMLAMTPASGFSGIVGGVFDAAKRLFPKTDTLEYVFKELTKILEQENRRFLVIIDDMDRLSPEEALAIFRLIKSVGRLPNVMYLVVFDRQLAEKAVSEKYPSEGPHFLEKIIQAGFDVPAPLPLDLNKAVLTSISAICGVPEEDQEVRFMNVFYDVVASYITSPRHVSRFQNAISVTWPAIAGDVNLADFIAMEILRLNEPTLYATIKSNKHLVCGTRDDHHQDRFTFFLKGISEERHELVKTTLMRLFPKMEDMGYGGEWRGRWDQERRICVDTHFDTYFRLSLSDEALSRKTIDELIEKAADSEFIQTTFRDASIIERRTGQSMVPVYLDELTTHGKKISKADVYPLLKALFQIHDDIDLEKDDDQSFMSGANTSLRYHWLIRRLTRDRFTIEERTALYLQAIETASMGWLVDFVSSARNDYLEPEGQQPAAPEDCLTTESVLPQLTELALKVIRTSAADGSLMRHPDLHYILYRWLNFMGDDPTEIRQWTDRLLESPAGLVALAKAMTGVSWSTGMGGFGFQGDRVSKATITAQIKEDSKIVDAGAFRKALVNIRESELLMSHDQDAVCKFLSAWDRQRS
ncbi:KAP family P-loop NTPase fold protein [Klebsiella aerogenes]